MSRHQVDPLRAVNADERQELERFGRSRREPAAIVARAKAVLVVADGATHTKAATVAGRRSGDAVAHLVARFNVEGVAALSPATVGRARRSARVPSGSASWPRHDGPRSRAGRDGHVVARQLAAGAPPRAERLDAGQHLHRLVCAERGGLELAAHTHLVPDGQGVAQAPTGTGDRGRPGCRGKKTRTAKRA